MGIQKPIIDKYKGNQTYIHMDPRDNKEFIIHYKHINIQIYYIGYE
jgi:hypothetical protein